LSRNLSKKQYQTSAPDTNNIELNSIATLLPLGIWYVNKEVSIPVGKILVIPINTTLISFYPITNSGTFTNEGRFCTASTFTCNAGSKFVNNSAYTLNYFNGVLNFYDSRNDIFNKAGKIINLESTYNDNGRGIEGEPVVNYGTPV
jgi:hypothetical protein